MIRLIIVQMLHQLFLDSLQALSSELQTNILELLTHASKSSHKMETLTMQLLSFKSQLYNILANLISNTATTLQTINSPYQNLVRELKQEVQSINKELFRYRLHHILKKKMTKKKRESSINSSLQQPNEELSQLQKSVLLIEKDLGLQAEDNPLEQLTISAILNRSLIGLQATPSTTQANYSLVSQPSKSQVDHSYIVSQQNYDLVAQNKLHIQANLEPKSTKALPTNNQSTPAPKKKNLVKTKVQPKEGLLGNLLQQSYQHLLQSK